MVYCVAQANFFFGIEIDEKIYSYDEIEELTDTHKEVEMVLAMMGDAKSKMFVASKVIESNDMELINVASTLGELYYATVGYAVTLRDFIKEHLPKIIYKDELLSWKLISSAWSST